jgi:predicted aconitase with swiveling domain
MVRKRTYKVRVVSPGNAAGPAVVMKERLSLKGSVDPVQGVFTLPESPLDGLPLSGKVLIFVSGKGSSSWSGYFKLACRHNSTPAAIVNLEIDPLVAAACVFNHVPLVQLENTGIFDEVQTGDPVTVDTARGFVIAG